MLFLRPTESLTVFLQQLGRGLRLNEGKEALTVLDFVGQTHKQYSFEDRFKALLSRTRKTVEHEIKHGFVNVPRGCSIQLEKQAQVLGLSESLGMSGFDKAYILFIVCVDKTLSNIVPFKALELTSKALKECRLIKSCSNV